MKRHTEARKGKRSLILLNDEIYEIDF